MDQLPYQVLSTDSKDALHLVKKNTQWKSVLKSLGFLHSYFPVSVRLKISSIGLDTTCVIL